MADSCDPRGRISVQLPLCEVAFPCLLGEADFTILSWRSALVHSKSNVVDRITTLCHPDRKMCPLQTGPFRVPAEVYLY